MDDRDKELIEARRVLAALWHRFKEIHGQVNQGQFIINAWTNVYPILATLPDPESEEESS